jgi:hypothetical protein
MHALTYEDLDEVRGGINTADAVLTGALARAAGTAGAAFGEGVAIGLGFAGPVGAAIGGVAGVALAIYLAISALD